MGKTSRDTCRVAVCPLCGFALFERVVVERWVCSNEQCDFRAVTLDGISVVEVSL